MSDYEVMDRDCDRDRDRDRDKDRDCVRCRRPGHPLPKPVLFECGTGNGFSFSSNSDTLSLTSPCQACTPKPVGVVTIDTTCLCQPRTHIEFSSNVHFVFNPFNNGKCSGRLQMEFQLWRNCDNGIDMPLSTWFYEIVDSDSNHAETFTFIYCDCGSCPGCCTYSVRVKPIEVDNCSICVNNSHISAIAKAGCN